MDGKGENWVVVLIIRQFYGRIYGLARSTRRLSIPRDLSLLLEKLR